MNTTGNINHDCVTNALTDKEIYSKFEKRVIEYINLVHDKNEFIYRLTDIQKYVNEDPTIPQIPKTTFYRYIKKMKIRRYEHPYNNKIYFDIDNSDYNQGNSFLEFNLSFAKYNKILYARVEPYLGELLSTLMNCQFDKKLFYSIYTQGLLTCHYFYDQKKSKPDNTYLTPAEIKKVAKELIEYITHPDSTN